MKKTAFLLIIITGILFMDSCKKDDTDPKLDMSKAVAPFITSPEEGASFVFTENNATNEFTISWTEAEYNIENLASTIYSVQAADADSSFDSGKQLVSTTETSFTATYGEINSILIGLGFNPDVAAGIKFRVSASLKSYDDGLVIEGTVLESPVVNNTMTPYESGGPVDYPKLWVPGDYQGWSPADAPNVLSFNDDGIYTGYLYFPDYEGATFEFKFTSEPSWDGINYGAGAEEGTLDTDGGAGNLKVPGPGGYRVYVDINNLTWTYELQNWGIIGEFNGWSEDINMDWDEEYNFLTLTYDFPDVPDNRFKFRANDSWDLNLGDIDPPDGETLTEGGGDIPITAGTWTINLILSGPDPKYQILEY